MITLNALSCWRIVKRRPKGAKEAERFGGQSKRFSRGTE